MAVRVGAVTVQRREQVSDASMGPVNCARPWADPVVDLRILHAGDQDREEFADAMEMGSGDG